MVLAWKQFKTTGKYRCPALGKPWYCYCSIYLLTLRLFLVASFPRLFSAHIQVITSGKAAF
ncbi:MAG: hypothetical protein JHC32_04915 [Candidatus Aminicenantes bacterium]|nr:hypothetical protein [Candidatus Aminicenantes bacterium]